MPDEGVIRAEDLEQPATSAELQERLREEVARAAGRAPPLQRSRS